MSFDMQSVLDVGNLIVALAALCVSIVALTVARSLEKSSVAGSLMLDRYYGLFLENEVLIQEMKTSSNSVMRLKLIEQWSTKMRPHAWLLKTVGEGDIFEVTSNRVNELRVKAKELLASEHSAETITEKMEAEINEVLLSPKRVRDALIEKLDKLMANPLYSQKG